MKLSKALLNVGLLNHVAQAEVGNYIPQKVHLILVPSGEQILFLSFHL